MHYVFTYSKDDRKVGCFPQSRTMTENYDYGGEDSVWKILDQEIDFEPNLDSVKLSGKAKITDLIFSSPIGSEVRGNLLVSSKFFEIFRKFKMPAFQKLEVQVYKKNKLLNYFLIHFWENQNHFVNFEASNFYVGSRLSFKYRDIQLKSFEEYTDTKMVLEQKFGKKINRRVIGVSKLTLKDEAEAYDFFRIRNMANLFVISEKLLNELLMNEITGFDYKPIQELKIKVYEVKPKDENKYEV